MKTKITNRQIIIVLLTLLFVSNAYGQIKIQHNGQVSLGTFSNSTMKGVQIIPDGCTYFNSVSNENWSWVTMASPKIATGKCWIVTYPNNQEDHRFYVTGYGYVYKRRSYTLSDNSVQSERDSISDPNAILDRITGFFYTPTEDSTRFNPTQRIIGISAKEIQEVLPEAVTTDKNGLYYLDYECLIPILIEGYKKQQTEIDSLKLMVKRFINHEN